MTNQTRTGFDEVLLPRKCNFQTLYFLFFFQFSEIFFMTKKGTEETAVLWWALGKSRHLQWEHAVTTLIEEILLPKNTSRLASASQPEPLILTCSCLLNGDNMHITATTERTFRAGKNQARIISIPSVTKQFVTSTSLLTSSEMQNSR